MSYYVWLMTPSLAFHINLSFITPFSPLKEKKNQELKLLDFLFFFVIKISSLRLQLNLSVCEKCARLLLFFFFFLILQILSHKDKVYY